MISLSQAALDSTLQLVLLLWYDIKSSLQTRRQTMYQCGLSEQLYGQAEQDRPGLWTDRGPASIVKP